MSSKYEGMTEEQLNDHINRLAQWTVIMFIGLMVFFAMAWLLYIDNNAFLLIVVIMMFGFLTVYYSQVYYFLRLLKKIMYPSP